MVKRRSSTIKLDQPRTNKRVKTVKNSLQVISVAFRTSPELRQKLIEIDF
jgi:hypothetical protein